MTTDDIEIINEKIQELINDKTEYQFDILKEKVEAILKNVSIFIVDGELDNKAVDMYLKNVITKRNNIKKQKEQSVDNSKETKYALIEAICKNKEFETQEELIKTISLLEKKTNFELNELLNKN